MISAGLVVIVLLVVIGYLLSALYLSIQEILFYPVYDHIWEPEMPHKKIMIEDRLSAWYFDSFPGNKAVLYCHGNYGNISYHDFIVKLCYQQKVNLLIFDYSGYGYSNGYPYQKNLCEDGITAYNYLRKFFSSEEIVIWGASLGGAIATYVASRQPCSHLILMSTFSSLDDLILDSGFGWLATCFTYLLRCFISNLNCKDWITEVACPVIILHSPYDNLVPFSNALRLYNNISHSQRDFIVIGGDHSTPKMTENDLRQLLTFCGVDASQVHLSRDVLQMIRCLRKKFRNPKTVADKLSRVPCNCSESTPLALSDSLDEVEKESFDPLKYIRVTPVNTVKAEVPQLGLSEVSMVVSSLKQ